MATFERGRTPWLPTPSSMDLHVMFDFDGPVVGTFTDRGDQFLFVRVIGDFNRLQGYAYSRLSKEDVAFIQQRPFGSTRDLRAWSLAKTAVSAKYAALVWDDRIELHCDVADELSEVLDAIEFLAETYQSELEETLYDARARVARLSKLTSVTERETELLADLTRADVAGEEPVTRTPTSVEELQEKVELVEGVKELADSFS